MVLDGFAKFQLTILALGGIIVGANLYEDHLRNREYQAKTTLAEESQILIAQGKMEKLFHISQTRLNFVPAIEIETDTFDKAEKLYRLQYSREYATKKEI